MANDIRQRIVLEGESEYNAALRAAQRNLKTLRSELRAETAELGNNATAQQKNQVKQKNLQKQIAEQEKVVRAYTQALEEVRERYGDNEDAIARYQQRLNDARTSLANLKNQLDATGSAFGSIASGAKQSVLETNALAQSFDRIAQAADDMAKKTENIFKGVASVIQGTIGTIWNQLMDMAAKSDMWMDLGSFLGASSTDVQKWDRAMKDIGGDITTITSMVSKLKYGGKDDKVTEWFGISAENYTDDLEYVQAVLQQMHDNKEEMIQSGTWDDAMSEIFGAKKVQEIDNILSDWDALMGRLEHWDVENGGMGLTEEEITQLDDLGQKVRNLRGDWEYLKQHWVMSLAGNLALNLTSNAQGALDALMAFMDAESQEERDKAIADFQKNIEEAFTALGEAIAAAGEALEKAGQEMQNSENGWVKLLGTVLEDLGKVMQWIADPDNLEKVKTFFEVLVGIWAGYKMAEAVGKLASMANSFKLMHSNKQLVSALSNLGNGGTGTGVPGAGGTGTVATMNVTTESVSSSTVANMVVQNMIGGPGTAPTAPATQPVVSTPPTQTINLGAGVPLGIGAGAGAGVKALPPAQNAAQNVLALEGDVGSVNTSGGIVLNAEEFTVGDASTVTAADKLGFGGIEMSGRWAGVSEKFANAATNPAVVAMAAALTLGPLVGKVAGGKDYRNQLEEYYGEKYTEASASEKLAMESGQSAAEAALHEQGKGSHWYDSGIFGDISDALDEGGLWVKHAAEDTVDSVKTGWNAGWAMANYALFGDDKYHQYGEKAERLMDHLLGEDKKAEEREKAEAEERTRNAEEYAANAKWGALNPTGYQAPDWFPANWASMSMDERLAFAMGIERNRSGYDFSGITDLGILQKFQGGDAFDILDALRWIENGGRTQDELTHDRMRDSQWEPIGSLPASWWVNQSTPGGDSDMKRLPGNMEQAVVRGMSGVKVIMDGEQVGYLVAPVVSQQIARNAG